MVIPPDVTKLNKFRDERICDFTSDDISGCQFVLNDWGEATTASEMNRTNDLLLLIECIKYLKLHPDLTPKSRDSSSGNKLLLNEEKFINYSILSNGRDYDTLAINLREIA